jgi:dTDP-glucose pyrophosphorylase
MQIIIPMSGFGERFRVAGYKFPKPLIEIDGKPIIAHVIDMFPGESDFIFICNEDHLNKDEYQMAVTLKKYCPSGRIIGIPSHKLGPVHAVLQVENLIDPLRPVVVNYCDFTVYWDWDHFKSFVQESRCVGCIPAYKGFHPHTLGVTNYAYLRESKGWVSDIQEKQPYTDNRMDEYASSGTYYFSTASSMFESFKQAIDENLNVGGEFYVSLAYKPLLADGQAVAVYDLQHFMQWGTPEDVVEYQGWSNAFKQLIEVESCAITPTGSLVMPMAGLGQRFKNQGYLLTKPLIAVSGQPMVAQATHDLPPTLHQVFVLRSDMPGHDDICTQLQTLYPKSLVTSIPEVTEGQACTALIGLECLEHEGSIKLGPVTFGACDNGALYDQEAFQRLLHNPKVDVIVWGVRGHANAIRSPHMFGWIDADDQGLVRRISVKSPLSQPESDPIVLGAFTFRSSADFRASVDRMFERDGRINNEFYIDEAINDALALGLRCHLFEVDHFLAWGTPDDLRTFEYWQSCFHKWAGHPYAMELDARIPPEAIPSLALRFQKTVPACPGQQL